MRRAEAPRQAEINARAAKRAASNHRAAALGAL